MPELRRSPRILARVPILVASEGPLHSAQTAVVNRHGALILCPENFKAECLLEIQNENTGECAKARVIWSGPEEKPGIFKLGIELVDHEEEFWGVDYDNAVPAEPQRIQN